MIISYCVKQLNLFDTRGMNCANGDINVHVHIFNLAALRVGEVTVVFPCVLVCWFVGLSVRPRGMEFKLL